MVRAGRNAWLIEEFLRGTVSLGWSGVGDLTPFKTQEEILRAYQKAYPNETKAQIRTGVAMLYKFRAVVKTGDKVITYNPEQREYWVGSFTSDYFFRQVEAPEHEHLRRVEWEGKVSRDKLGINARNSLGSVLTLFLVNDETWTEIKKLLHSRESPFETEETSVEETAELKEGFVLTRNELREKAHELVKDKIVSLSPDELEELAAALLRAMGFQARVSPTGADRGVDVFASPDGLGLKEPRIKVEVKHRQKTQIGSQDLRSFIGVLRHGDKGLYVSTGGFTKDAKYEADRSNHPVTLLDLDELANLIVTHYENFNVEGRALIPLTKIYLPNE